MYDLKSQAMSRVASQAIRHKSYSGIAEIHIMRLLQNNTEYTCSRTTCVFVTVK